MPLMCLRGADPSVWNPRPEPQADPPPPPRSRLDVARDLVAAPLYLAFGLCVLGAAVAFVAANLVAGRKVRLHRA